MTDADLLTALKTDLGIASTGYDARLNQLIDTAKAAVTEEGVETLDTAGSLNDAQIVIMYARWLWNRRETMDAMPRMLRWALNNRIFGERSAGK